MENQPHYIYSLWELTPTINLYLLWTTHLLPGQTALDMKHLECRAGRVHVRNTTSDLHGNGAAVEPGGAEQPLLNLAQRIQTHEREGRLWILQTKWLHILEQFLGPAVVIILSIAFQCAGAPIQMVLWRSIKNNFAHRQAQEGPGLTTGREAQMPA